MSEPLDLRARDNPRVQRWRKLASDPGAYRKAGEVWLDGEHLCEAWLQQGAAPLHAVVTESGWALPAIRHLAESATDVVRVPAALMGVISTLESPPPIAFVVPWRGTGTVMARVATVVLDRVQDPGNVGTLLRSAAAFGFTQVVALTGTAALWSPKVLRAAMGAHFVLDLVELADAGALAQLEVPLLATSPHAAESVCDVALPWPCAWLLGHEGQGLSADLMARCDQALAIPQFGAVESLNVAAAAAVCLYESARQRRAATRQG